MSIAVHRSARQTGKPAVASARAQIALAVAILCGLVAVAFVRSPFDGNGDTAWLLHAAGRFLDGRSLYTEIFETNPPMAILIYVPPVWLARTLGGAVQLWTHAWVVTIIAGSLLLVWALSPRAGVHARTARLALIAALAFSLLIMPSRMFAQREHIAAALLIVYLMACAAAARGRLWPRRPSPWLASAAALAGAVAIAIKPHFALVALGGHVALLIHWLATHRRDSASRGEGGTRPLGRWIARIWQAGGAGLHAPATALLVLAYGAATWIWASAYVNEMVPMLAIVYAPHRLMSVPAMLASAHGAAFLMAAAAAALLAWRRRGNCSVLVVLAGASAGGFAGFLIQGKGFPYHLIPALVPLAGAAALALCHGARDHGQSLLAPLSAVLSVAFAVVLPMQLDQHHRPRALEAKLARLGENRSILIAAGDLGYAWPLVTRLGWSWTGRSMGLLMAKVAAARLESAEDPAQIAAIRRALEADIDRFVEDALATRPDVMAFRTDEPERLPHWIAQRPTFASMLEDYARVGHADGVLVLARAGLSLAASPSHHGRDGQ